MIYLLHGDEEFLRAEALRRIKDALGDPEMASLNTAVLDGRQVTAADVQGACDAMPFLADRRLVIVEGMLGKALARTRRAADDDAEDGGDEAGGKADTLDAISAYLPHVPDTTDLVFVETVTMPANRKIMKRLAELARGGQARIESFSAPKQQDLAGWVGQRAKAKGAKITVEAAQLLADAVGPQLRLLDQELGKLATYALDRAITPQDVQRLVAATREANIFQLVEALGQDERRAAFVMLRELLDEGQPALVILTMIARQFRLLLQAKELTAQGLQPLDAARQMGWQGWQAERLIRQARRFSFVQLEAAFDQMLATDLAIKTGQLTDELALELLVVMLDAPLRPAPAHA